MSNKTMKLPVICTRGIIIFPGLDVTIEVGRPKSVRAVDLAEKEYDKEVLIVCQKDIMIDNPTIHDLYSYGTLSKIKVKRRKEGFLRVTFGGNERAKITNIYDDGDMMFAEVEIIEDTHGNAQEEVALVKRIINEIETSSNIGSIFP
ncbi:MAG: LON peptidase substrate-binding domain-containing protein, partial [Solobacterium sp.]|nr:LON peptidase substrate-binding domain-containing protein [Solobacterium sp.]